MNNYVGLKAELSHDKKRGTNVFAGINLRYHFKQNQLTKLKRKMAQIPARYVDIVVREQKEKIDYEEALGNVYLVSTKDELRAALMAGLNSYKGPDDDRRPVIIVAGDIVATDADRDWRPIGDRDNQFSGTIHSGYIGKMDYIIKLEFQGLILANCPAMSFKIGSPHRF